LLLADQFHLPAEFFFGHGFIRRIARTIKNNILMGWPRL
jgi:hypothetical protein